MKHNELPEYVELIARLKAKRDHFGWTQKYLAVKLSRSQGYVAKIETGSQRVDLIEFHKWARALRIDAVALVKELFDALEAPPDGQASASASEVHASSDEKRVRVRKPPSPTILEVVRRASSQLNAPGTPPPGKQE